MVAADGRFDSRVRQANDDGDWMAESIQGFECPVDAAKPPPVFNREGVFHREGADHRSMQQSPRDGLHDRRQSSEDQAKHQG